METEMGNRGNQFIDVALKVGSTVAKKNILYGDSFNQSGKILEILYPNGVGQRQYKSMLAVTRVIDKLFRIAKAADDDNEDPWFDIAGYATLMLAYRDDAKAKGSKAGEETKIDKV